jgi:serine/threonine-protein kinase
MEAESQEDQPRFVGPLRVLCELGHGSMAVVYLARATGPAGFERLFALKMIHPHLSVEGEFVELFLNEARIAASIHHPNVIGVHEIGVHGGRTYLKMDYASGETLAQALDRTWNQGRPFPFDAAGQILGNVADGLHAAHELGIIHRDVGPPNILIGYDGTSRVMDFGIAKALDRVSGTKPGTWRGTVAFMSPEQVRGEPLDRRADLFSLGVVLWETTVGARLFRHRTIAGTMSRVLSLEVPRPSTLREDYPAELERIVLKALERDRDRRYATGLELGDDLRRFLVGHGVTTGASRVAEWMRELFAERLQERLAMERAARRQDASGQILQISPAPPTPEVERRIADEDGGLAADAIDALGSTHLSATQPVAAQEREASEPEHGRTRFGPLVESTEPFGVGPLLSSAAIPEEGARPAVTAVTARIEPLRRPRRASIPPADASVPPVRAFGLLVLALVAASGLGLFTWLRPKDRPPAPPPTMVRLSFALEPASALLRIDGAAHEGDLVAPLSAREYSVEVSADGYQGKTLIVSAEASRTIAVRLEPLPARPPVRSHPPARRHRR